MKDLPMNRNLSLALLASTALLAAGFPVRADVLELKSGQVVTGKFAGGTAATIRFETASGLQVFETSQVVALTFTGAPAAAAPATPAATPAPAATTTPAPAAAPAAPAVVAVPTGTVLLVRMVDGASSNDPAGKRFTSTLESDLTVNGTLVARAGTKVYGRVQAAQKAGRYAGQSKLDLRLSELTVGGTLVPIVTDSHGAAGSKSMGKTARGAAAGAAIGAIADGGDGAAKGAAIGAVASGLKRGQPIVVSPGTLLEFQLEQPLSVTPAR